MMMCKRHVNGLVQALVSAGIVPVQDSYKAERVLDNYCKLSLSGKVLPRDERMVSTKKHRAQVIGRKIHDLRKVAGMSQQQLANSVGCSQNRISDWERGVRYACSKNLRKIALVLNVSETRLGFNTNEESGPQAERTSAICPRG
jgi:DNA-binding transcriptional regulator YiaG